MAKVKAPSSDTPKRRARPAVTEEARQSQMIALAEDCAEKQLREGTAPAQIIVHYLKLATERERAELKKLETENLLAQAKIEQIKSEKSKEEMFKAAIDAMRSYRGLGGPEDED
jgi:hypothetical protein